MPAADTTTTSPATLAAHAAVAELLLHAAVPADALDAFTAALPTSTRTAGIATLLAVHPHRSSTLFAAGYRAQLTPHAARALLTRVPLTGTEAAHAVAVDATRTRDADRRTLLAEVLLTAGPQLSDATLEELTRAAGGTPIDGDRATREAHAAATLGIAGIYPLTARVRALHAAHLDHTVERLTILPPGRPRIHVAVEKLTDDDMPAVGPWLASRIGPDTAAWALLAATITPGTTTAGLAAVVTAVLAPPAPGHPARTTSRLHRTLRAAATRWLRRGR